MMPAEPPASLYERLGGVYSIATVVDDFIDRVMTDPRLNANPAVDEAHHKVPPAGFKYLVTEMVCWAAGGRHGSPRPGPSTGSPRWSAGRPAGRNATPAGRCWNPTGT